MKATKRLECALERQALLSVPISLQSPGSMAQVQVNLLLNALEYLPEEISNQLAAQIGTGRIHINRVWG